MKKRLFNREKGLTLVEIMISFFIFSLIVGSVTGIFVSSIGAQKRLLDEQKLSSEMSYVLEYIGRALRMAKLDTEGHCTAAITPPLNYYSSNGNSISFRDYEGNCQEFLFDEGRILEKRKNYSADPWEIGLALTSGDIEIVSLSFNNGGSDWSRPVAGISQPKVIIVLEARHRDDESVAIISQTMISQRELNIVQ